MRLVLALALLLVGCATVELVDSRRPPDAGRTGPCPSAPVVYCDAGALGGATCGTEPDAGDYRSQIPPGEYVVGCVVDFPDPVPLRDTGECTLRAQCRCNDPRAEAGTAWACIP